MNNIRVNHTGVRGGARKTLKKLPLWREWVRKYYNSTNPKSAHEIAQEYINPRTGEPYSPQQVFRVINKYDQGEFEL